MNECKKIWTDDKAGMVQAFREGIEWYQPMDRQVSKMEEEGGVTDHSKTNVNYLIHVHGAVIAIDHGPNDGMLFCFADGTHLLTSGFCVGYGGTAPSELAKLLESWGTDDALKHIICMKRNADEPFTPPVHFWASGTGFIKHGEFPTA